MGLTCLLVKSTKHPLLRCTRLLVTNPNSFALPSSSRQQSVAGSKNVTIIIQKHRRNLDAWGRLWPTHIPDEYLGDYTLKLTFPFWIKIFQSSDFNLLQRTRNTKKLLSVGICFPLAFLDCLQKNQDQCFPADTASNTCTQSTGSYQIKFPRNSAKSIQNQSFSSMGERCASHASSIFVLSPFL